MGCDIHLRVEQRCKVNPYPNDTHIWQSCGFCGEFSSRIYGMFARMADVRSYMDSYKVQFKPRGLPDNMSPLTEESFYREVTNDKDLDGYESFVSREEAEQWVNEGNSKWVDEAHKRVTDPDLHSRSWLTTQELRQCFDDCFRQDDGSYQGDYVEWLGLVSLCEGIESDGIHECRVVFAFDNQ